MKRQFQAFNYKVVNQAEDTLDVYIDGVIVDADTQQILRDWFGDETSVSYKSFRDQVLNAAPKKVNIYINSGGGLVTDAMAIHDFIKDRIQNGVTVNTIGRGVIASAATYILMAGGENASISENSWFMIHGVSGMVWGNVNEIENYAKAMRKFNDQIVGFYAKATGLSETVIENMMDKETWMTASETREKGFVKNISGKADFSNTIKPEHWPYNNTAVLNAYNAAVKVPQAIPENLNNSFFTEIKNGFMSLVNELKGAISNGKTDKKFENVENRDSILDMVNQVLSPVVNKIDEAIANAGKNNKPANEQTEEKTEESTAGSEKKEESAEEGKDKGKEKKEDKPAEEETVTEESPELKAANARIAKMENDMKELRNALAGKATKPENGNGKTASAGFTKAKVHYED